MASTDLIVKSDSKSLPAHLKTASGAGNENVNASDMTIPSIKLLQDLSPETKESKAEFVPGAKPGLILNTLDNSLHEELIVINLYYDHEYAVFRKRKFGGGFHGAFPTEEAAIEKAKEEGGGSIEMFEIVETGRHTVLIVDTETGDLQPALLNMNSTKLKTSRRWNTELSQLGGDRFSSAWKISTVEESNSKGTFHSFRISNLGWVNDELYAKAKEFYEQIKASYSKEKDKATEAA